MILYSGLQFTGNGSNNTEQADGFLKNLFLKNLNDKKLEHQQKDSNEDYKGLHKVLSQLYSNTGGGRTDPPWADNTLQFITKS